MFLCVHDPISTCGGEKHSTCTISTFGKMRALVWILLALLLVYSVWAVPPRRNQNLSYRRHLEYLKVHERGQRHGKQPPKKLAGQKPTLLSLAKQKPKAVAPPAA